MRAVAPFRSRGTWRIPEQAPRHVGQQGREVGAAHRGAVSSGSDGTGADAHRRRFGHARLRVGAACRPVPAIGADAPDGPPHHGAPGRDGCRIRALLRRQRLAVLRGGWVSALAPHRGACGRAQGRRREVSATLGGLGRLRGGAWPLVRRQFALQALQRASHAVLDSRSGRPCRRRSRSDPQRRRCGGAARRLARRSGSYPSAVGRHGAGGQGVNQRNSRPDNSIEVACWSTVTSARTAACQLSVRMLDK